MRIEFDRRERERTTKREAELNESMSRFVLSYPFTFDEYLFIDSGEMMQLVCFMEISHFRAYEEIWKVLNLVSLHFSQQVFRTWWKSISSSSKVLKVHSEELRRYIKFELLARFVNELFTKNISQSESIEKCRSGSVGYVPLASQQAWTNSRSNVYRRTSKRTIKVDAQKWLDRDWTWMHETRF